MANLILHVRKTPTTAAARWRDTGGDHLFTGTSVASGDGRQGAQHDFGVITTAIEREYEWRAWTQLVATPGLGELIYIYWKTSDGTHPDNDHGTGDIDVLAADIDKLRNLTLLGAIEVDEAAANIEFVAQGRLLQNQRYGQPVFWNASAAAMTATASEHGFDLTAVASEVQ